MIFRMTAIALAFWTMPLLGQGVSKVDFEPRAGNSGVRVIIKSPVPRGAVVKFGQKPVSLLQEENSVSFFVPEGSSSSFIEIVDHGKTIAKSSVPFVVAGASMAAPQRLIGLKEAIDVFGYVDPIPEGVITPAPRIRPIFKIGDQDILTIGEPPLQRLGPAVDASDTASLAKQSMGYGFMITARPPSVKRPTPTPVPEN